MYLQLLIEGTELGLDQREVVSCCVLLAGAGQQIGVNPLPAGGQALVQPVRGPAALQLLQQLLGLSGRV